MPRARDKECLLSQAVEKKAKLDNLIASMTEQEQVGIFPFDDRDRNIRDILIHLYEWHQLLLNWVKANQKGDTKPFLPEPYNWKTYPQMNIEFWQKHQNTGYEEAKVMLAQSHADVIALLKPFSDDALFNKKHFSWTGSTSLGSYAVSATASHYDWAIKKIKKYKKKSIAV